MWYNHEDIPYKDMWPDDILWFPLMLQSKQFYGYFKFQGMNDIVDYKLKEVDDIHSVIIPPCPQQTCGW
jgi:8-oxo-dGTP diphosphatase/2-hydroxy-dATP diphosphatase